MCTKQCCERHPTAVNIARVRVLFVDDGQLMIRQLEWLMATEMCNLISCDIVHHIVKDKLIIQKVSVRWMSCQLSHKLICQDMAAIEFLTLYDWKGEAFIQCIVKPTIHLLYFTIFASVFAKHHKI